MKRIWKPLDVGGLRLYVVERRFLGHRNLDQTLVVAAKSPRHALKLVQDVDTGTEWIYEPMYFAKQLNILQPESWWQSGIPEVGQAVEHCLHPTPPTARSFSATCPKCGTFIGVDFANTAGG